MMAEGDSTQHFRGAKRPSFLLRTPLIVSRGRREGRVPTCTHGPRAEKKHAAEPQVQADQPAFPAQWFYGLYVISLVTGLSCHRHPQDAVRVFADLTPASGRQ